MSFGLEARSPGLYSHLVMKPWTSCLITVDLVFSSGETKHGVRMITKLFFCFDLVSTKVKGERRDGAGDKSGA